MRGKDVHTELAEPTLTQQVASALCIKDRKAEKHLRRRCRAGTSERKAVHTWKSLSNRWSRMHHCRFHCSVVVSISLHV